MIWIKDYKEVNKLTIFQDLVKVYDNNQNQAGKFEVDRYGKQYTLLPSSHVSVSIQLEVTLDSKGNFITANKVNKDDKTTVIPATIKSANRSNKPVAHPLQDKIKYVAGDYEQYAVADKDAAKCRSLYYELLAEWAESPQSNSKIQAIYNYQKKNCLIRDLVETGEIELDGKGQLNPKDKDLFVRFNINDKDPNSPVVWQDQVLFQSWIDFYTLKLVDTQPIDVDYLTGERVPTTKLSEKNINSVTSGAKLISANDAANFTYRGIFQGDDFYSVGYDSSQKMVHALKWLIQRQGLKSGSRVFLFWMDNPDDNRDVMAVTGSCIDGLAYLDTLDEQEKDTTVDGLDYLDSISEEDSTDTDDSHPETGASIAKAYRRRIQGYSDKLDERGTVHAMFLDAATTGRMATVYFNDMVGGTFKKNLELWTNNCVAVLAGQRIWQPSARALVRSTYTNGRGGQRTDVIEKQALSRIIINIINGQSISDDLLRTLYIKILHPQSYEKLKQWQNDLYTYTAVDFYNYSVRGGKPNMTLNRAETDRSYLYGRLLGIADDVESKALELKRRKNSNVSDRMTTALRFFTNFAERPATTWTRILQSLIRSSFPQIKNEEQIYYKQEIKEISNFLNDLNDDQPLNNSYVKGFMHQQVADDDYMASLKAEKHSKED